MTVRFDYPFSAQFELPEFGSNSRELRTYALHDYLRASGMELGHAVEEFHVVNFQGDDNGEIWRVEAGKY